MLEVRIFPVATRIVELYRFTMLMLLLVLTSSTIYANLAAQTEYHVMQLPQSCWQDYTYAGGGTP